ncbi:CBS-domain-containing protein [Rhizoclosmatium globosum]|uniref:CBS-domain-containing protein n=1 Tax=Rhizoclosmatium globosum TaxID=329046 RepID=A0A1Y2B1U4_9FUNG|nr:CBS-domain-containing protein [Rhizoclosmatium globosum]|eukprot:ORY28706.1 CBS-domain-containing protein [Rhizoclosmatium globosum]
MSSSATVTADASSSEAFKLLFSETTCGQVLERPSRSSGPKIPICLDTDLSVQDACNALAAHRISSAPVYSPEQGGFIGMFDYRDLVTYVLEVFRKVPKEEASFDAEMEITDIIKRASMDRTGVPIKLVSNLSQQNPLVAVYTTTPLLTALQEFANNSALHRIVVLEKCDGDKDKFVGVLSQSLICGLVAEKFGRLPRKTAGRTETDFAAGELSLQQLGLVKGENSVVTVDLNDTVLEALYAMHTNHVSSVAIVDKAHGHSKLEGSVSMTDIKEILSSRGGWRHLYDPCFRFFVQLRSVQGLEANGSDRVPLFTVHPSTPLIVAVEKMAATKTHRVWIVSESGKGDVVGVLGLSDVMPFLAAACQPE